jgi:hypothetical protein
MNMVYFLRLGFLAWTAIFLVSACSGKTAEQEASAAQASKEAAAKPAPAPEAAENKTPDDAAKDSSDKDDRKERAGSAFKALYCTGAVANTKGAADTYKEHGFKGTKHFLKTWTHYAKKDSEWAHGIAQAAEKMDCKK